MLSKNQNFILIYVGCGKDFSKSKSNLNVSFAQLHRMGYLDIVSVGKRLTKYRLSDKGMQSVLKMKPDDLYDSYYSRNDMLPRAKARIEAYRNRMLFG
jgi:hypothetical protein